jgi:hypothetical protein
MKERLAMATSAELREGLEEKEQAAPVLALPEGTVEPLTSL